MRYPCLSSTTTPFLDQPTNLFLNPPTQKTQLRGAHGVRAGRLRRWLPPPNCARAQVPVEGPEPRAEPLGAPPQVPGGLSFFGYIFLYLYVYIYVRVRVRVCVFFLFGYFVCVWGVLCPVCVRLLFHLNSTTSQPTKKSTHGTQPAKTQPITQVVHSLVRDFPELSIVLNGTS